MYGSARRRRRTMHRKPRSRSESRQKVWTAVLVVAVCLAVLGLRQVNALMVSRELAKIRQLPDSIALAGFALPGPRNVEIEIVGANQVRELEGSGGAAFTKLENVWLVHAGSKERVWGFSAGERDAESGGGDAHNETVSLDEGEYALYCTSRKQRRSQPVSWVDWLEGDPQLDVQPSSDGGRTRLFNITVTGRGSTLSENEIVAALAAPIDTPAVVVEDRSSAPPPPPRRSGSNPVSRSRSRTGAILVELTRLEDNESTFSFFELDIRSDVRIVAIGEGMNGEMYDYGWLVNTSNGRTVWEMRYRDSEHAGGNRKNRLVDTTLTLRRGEYVAYFVTDDSHSYDDWNASPPDDERGWGVRVLEAVPEEEDEYDRRRGTERWAVAAQLTGIRDDVRRRAWFTLDKRSLVRVYALGEGDRSEMYDYAWVEDADTRQTIWEMTYRASQHAGGASKNRMVDTTGWLPAGEYVVRYRSDDSHSPESWNDDPPRDRRNYGVTVFVERR